MLVFKNFFLPIKRNALILIAMYLIGVLSTLIIYLFDYVDSIFFHSFLFLIVLIINRLANQFHIFKEKIIKYLYFSELCFVIYLIFVVINGSNHFLQYKLLIVPSVLLSIFQIFGLKRIKKGQKL